MRNYLVIFLDGFPYRSLEKLDSLNKFSCKASLMTGIGYSINIHSEIFAGLSADQIGFFNTWKFEPETSPFRMLKRIKRWLGYLQDNRYLNWLLRKAINRICGCDSLNIPYKFIDMFTPCGCSIYSENFPASKLLPNKGLERSDIIFGTDLERYELAKEGIKRDGRLSVFFIELDKIGHKFGLDSQEYADYLTRLNGWLHSLCDRFRAIYPDGDIVILSDHGMSQVKRAIRFDLKRDAFLREAQAYVYFLDTTMLRIWYLDSTAKSTIESFLNSVDYGRLLTDRERVNYGIANKKWGDSIFLLNEGCVFDPSFLEKGHSLAMHGYHPSLSRQSGIFLYSGPKSLNIADTITTIECHKLLKEIL